MDAAEAKVVDQNSIDAATAANSAIWNTPGVRNYNSNNTYIITPPNNPNSYDDKEIDDERKESDDDDDIV